MERSVMFVQSLLLLVVVIYSISACLCPKATMEEAICMTATLLMGTPESVEYADIRGNPVTTSSKAALAKYNMYLNVMYHEGPNAMGEHDNFVLLTSHKLEDCGVQLEIGTNYIISGAAMNKTHILTIGCNYIESVPWNKTEEELEVINDLLTGHVEVKCNSSKTCVGLFGELMFC